MHMNTHDPDSIEPWHSPQRAWAPLMWLIRAVAIALATALLVPLLQLVVWWP
jgi:hypothetical protein